MKKYFVIVETKQTEKFPIRETVAQIKIEAYNKLLLGYEWGKICCNYPEDLFISTLVETKEDLPEFKRDKNNYYDETQ